MGFLMKPVNQLINTITIPPDGKQISRFDAFFFKLTKGLIGLTIVIFVITPVMAYLWNRKPFPGFLLEQTLVVNSVGNHDWSGRKSGLDFPQQIIEINGLTLDNIIDFHQALSNTRIGQTIEVITRDMEGLVSKYPSVLLQDFPGVDFFSIFWLPYLVGLFYLVSALLVYRSRGNTRSGSVFTFTAVMGALSLALMFDLSTTHLGSLIWMIAISQVGGALISLALVFPEELQPVYRRVRIRILAHGISLGLAIWGVVSLYNMENPWAYVLPWRWSYIYGGLGSVVFLLVMGFRLRISSDTLAYQQARIIFWGSLIAFSPLAFWFLLQLWIPVTFPSFLLVPPLIIFPVVVGLAILRYRLWDIDLIIRKTIVYSFLMGVLSLVYLFGIILLQTMLNIISQEWSENLFRSPLAIILSTLVIVGLFSPLRNRIQRWVDRSFYRNRYDAEKVLQRFSEHLRDDVDLDQVTTDLLLAVEETMHPEKISLWLKTNTTRPSAAEHKKHSEIDPKMELKP